MKKFSKISAILASVALAADDYVFAVDLGVVVVLTIVECIDDLFEILAVRVVVVCSFGFDGVDVRIVDDVSCVE